ncbi:MscL family protein [Allobranchiibius huperziae]|uniref:Large conductance mechanosensitive channel n=1 Tax=Allobranchiibius huperziae TaxID=1874116 RepID=A0A853DEA8_9MICO|nr:MscL family protein [Allobranchiibius huperziae]NYJ74319.1 large conductance mechanosensitive channel [Allobranchiibius huperziae]
MQGFKDFIMRGNLVELAVAFVIATAFARVVQALVVVIMDIVGKIGGSPSFSSYQPSGIHVGDFITALIGFLLLAAVVYFFVVVPYNKATELALRRRKGDVEIEDVPTELDLLVQIRDELRAGPRA